MTLLLLRSGHAEEGHVGARTCASCHPKQFELWKRSDHAKAFDSLAQKQQSDPKCVPCHTLSEEPELASVQCESCHGPGRYYTVSYVMKDKELAGILGLVPVDEKTCRKCHTASSPSIRKFNYEEARQKITHWQPWRADAPAGQEQDGTKAQKEEPPAGSKDGAEKGQGERR